VSIGGKTQVVLGTPHWSRFCLALLDEAWFRYEFDGICECHVPLVKHCRYRQ
jgi:hypothetical protein